MKFLGGQIFLIIVVSKFTQPTSWTCGVPTFLSQSNKTILVPWAAKIYRGDYFISSAVIISPSMILTAADVFIHNNRLDIYPFETYRVTVGVRKWESSHDNEEQVLKIGHIAMYPGTTVAYKTVDDREYEWASQKINPVLLHLEKAQIFNPAKQRIMLTGWEKGTTDLVYKNLIVQPESECSPEWTASTTGAFYFERFCAKMEEGEQSERCLWHDFGPAKSIDNGPYYLLAPASDKFSRSIYRSCSRDSTFYYFLVWTNSVILWIRQNERCGSTSYTCWDGKCIPLHKICNRAIDCINEEDEDKLFCPRLYKCSEGEFQCGGEDQKCIPLSKVGDGVADCAGSEDEPVDNAKIAVYITLTTLSLIILLTLVFVGLYFLRIELANRSTDIENIKLEIPTEIRTYSFENNESEQNNLSSTQDSNPPPNPWRTDDSLQRIKKLGEGYFGQVYEAMDQTDVVNPKVAIKCVNIRKTLHGCNNSSRSIPAAGFLGTLLNEIAVHSELTSDYVVRYITCWAEAEDFSHHKLDRGKLQTYVDSILENSYSLSGLMWAPTSNLFIKMELCQFTLKYFLENNHLIHNYANEHVAPIFKDITIGLNYIHQKGYIHRDIKPGNIFCKIDPVGGCIWKIGDLGLATKYSGSKHFEIVGTENYQSPELKSGSGYTTRTDVYSLGLVFLKLVQRKMDFLKELQTCTKLSKLSSSRDRYLYLKDDLVQDEFAVWAKIINKMVNPDQTKRISCNELEVVLSKISI